MRRFRLLRRALLILFVSVCAVVFLALVFVQVEQRIFRRRAERLLGEMQSLELRKTPWPEAQAQLAHWGAHTEVSPHCDEHKCSLQITLYDSVLGYHFQRNLFVRLDDYIRWRLHLSYSFSPFEDLEQALARLSMRMGGHPARIAADVGMRDGIVWSKSLIVWIETYVHNVEGCSGGEWCEYTLGATLESVSRFGLRGGEWVSAQLLLHPNYLIGHPGGCTGCLEGWVEFTPYAEPADVHRFMQLNLSCLTRWRPCRSQIDIMPNAWKQYEAEGPRVDAIRDQFTCSPLMIEMLGRDNAHLAVGEIVAYAEPVEIWDYHDETASVRLLDRLKGAEDWRIGEIRELPVRAGKAPEIENLRPGTRLIFAGDFGYTNRMEIDLRTPCHLVSPNEANMSLVRRGIAQDYLATEQVK